MVPVFMGKVAVVAPGTPVRVTTDLTRRVAAISFTAVPGASGAIYIGGAGMVKATLVQVARKMTIPSAGVACDTFLVPMIPGGGAIHLHVLADYWIDADGAGDGPLVTYWLRR